MFRGRVSNNELSFEATKLRAMLEGYGHEREAARTLLARAGELIDRAINKEIHSTLVKGFFPPELWQDGPLGDIDELVEVAARFNLLLRGAASIQEVEKMVHGIETKTGEDFAWLERLRDPTERS